MPVIFIRRKPLLTRQQMQRSANILDNAGQVFLAVAVLSPLLTNIDSPNWGVVVSGLVITIVSWFGSIWLTKQEEKYGT
jgi:hypothetical protein